MKQIAFGLIVVITMFLALFTGPANAILLLNPAVSASTVGTTICVPGYTKTVRPSASYARGVKRRLLVKQGVPFGNIADYELDHIIPLTLGGHPHSLDNLALQKWDDALIKDRLEPRLNRLVCSNKLQLYDAQACIYTGWQACARRFP